MANSFGSIINIGCLAAKRSLRQPAFLVAVAVLLVAAIGLNGAVAELKLHFKKLPVPLARELTEIPPLLGTWLQISRDEPLNHDIQEVLETDKYIFRDYINLQAYDGQPAADLLVGLSTDMPADQQVAMRNQFLSQNIAGRARMLEAAMKDKNTIDRKNAIAMVQFHYNDAVVNLAVTYYTGLVDTVAHVPDRCYIASGFQETDRKVPTWDMGPGRQPLTVRLMQFEGDNGMTHLERNVAYFFHVNGHYDSDPIGVRLSLQNLFEKYGYYSKVELMTIDTDHDRSTQTMQNFLKCAVPEIEKSYPNWQLLHSSNGK